MRNGLVLILIGIFSAFVTVYFLQTVSPVDTSKLQELAVEKGIQKNDWERFDLLLDSLITSGQILLYIKSEVWIGIGLGLVTIFTVFSGFHITIDKLFFKKYYEQPHYRTAFRRGLLLTLAAAFMYYIRINRLNDWYLLIPPVLFFSIEYYITMEGRKHMPVEETKAVEPEKPDAPIVQVNPVEESLPEDTGDTTRENVLDTTSTNKE